jgi:hypothetical protein
MAKGKEPCMVYSCICTEFYEEIKPPYSKRKIRLESDGHTSSEARALYEKLDEVIQAYFKQIDLDLGWHQEGDYIASWAVVVNEGNLLKHNGYAGGYQAEMMPRGSAPHAIKGLLQEGVNYFDNPFQGPSDEDEDDD